MHYLAVLHPMDLHVVIVRINPVITSFRRNRFGKPHLATMREGLSFDLGFFC